MLGNTENGSMLRIICFKGIIIRDYARQPLEDEVLFMPFTKFFVEEINPAIKSEIEEDIII
jgi:hypothetical protein